MKKTICNDVSCKDIEVDPRKEFTEAFGEWSYLHEMHKQLDKYHQVILKNEELHSLEHSISDLITELESIVKFKLKWLEKVREAIENEQ